MLWLSTQHRHELVLVRPYPLALLIALLILPAIAPDPTPFSPFDAFADLEDLDDVHISPLDPYDPFSLQTDSDASDLSTVGSWALQGLSNLAQLGPPLQPPMAPYYYPADTSYDIECLDLLPSPAAFPPSRPRAGYTDLRALCAYNGKIQWTFTAGYESRNLGCGCGWPGVQSTVFCQPPPLADPVLHQQPSLAMSCEFLCRCRIPPAHAADADQDDELTGGVKAGDVVASFTAEDVHAYKLRDGRLIGLFAFPDRGVSYTTTIQPVAALGTQATAAPVLAGGAEEGTRRAPRRKSRNRLVAAETGRRRKSERAAFGRPRSRAGGLASFGQGFAADNRGVDGTCGGPCNGLQCVGDGCRCLLNRVGRDLWEAGVCGIAVVAASAGRRKRGEASVCACNATYVGPGCCGSVDGMVWEGREGWLGRLVGAEEEGDGFGAG
ncbi:MAG: hypothetical protein M1824_002944 [Vezdaea acicularis]|nr:MAG: hypothetical protein M1824_002944 [Vezdaea acicularis]